MIKLNGSALAIATEGMGGRLKTKGGQLVPLKKRMNPVQLEKRVEKITARRTVAERLVRQQEQFMLGVFRSLQGYFGRGFFGRMKWLLVGR